MADLLFSIRNLEFSYEDHPVLSVDHLELQEGHVHVLVGPNGSGKTTLLKLMDGLLKPSAGTILFRGRPLSAGAEAKGSVYVHQRPYLFSGSVRDNIAYGLKIRGVGGDELDKKVSRALESVGLSGFEKRRSGKLSGGEAQRTAIARALTLTPEVLLLDEPTAGVDRDSVLRLEEIISSIRRDYGTTVIVSTHDHPFGYRVADRVIHIDEGKAGGISENLLKGRVTERTEDVTTFVCGSVSILAPAGQGDANTAVIDYEQIILSSEPLASSARNNLRGAVLDIKTSEHCAEVFLDVGIPLTARLTVVSVEKLALAPGKDVYAAFKASAVRLY